MKTKSISIFVLFVVLISACSQTPIANAQGEVVPLKDAKLNIEHNATDLDTGFQGFVDGEGWKNLVFTGPDGVVLTIDGQGNFSALGLTEVFFETVEPENADVPIADMLAKLPEGYYTIAGSTVDNGQTSGSAWLTHKIPAGAELLSPTEGQVISASEDLVVRWSPVTKTIDGADVNIISYQLIIEKDEAPHPHMIGKFGLSMYLSGEITTITIPNEFFEPATSYKWEVLAIEESGNQTLSSGTFQTQ